MSSPKQALFIIPFITGPISFLSSIYLVYSILFTRGRKQWKKAKEQLLLGLSLLDICGSFAHSFSTLPGPYWIHGRYPTMGNNATCRAQGFLTQLSLGAPMYNACICIYYLLVVRYQYRVETITKWVLPLMHMSVFVFSVGTALGALWLDVLGFNGLLGCWVNDSPQWRCHCDYEEDYNEQSTITSKTNDTDTDTFYDYNEDMGGFSFVKVPKDNHRGYQKAWGCYGEATLCGHGDWMWNEDCATAITDQVDHNCVECQVCPDIKGDADRFAWLAGALPVTICFIFVVVSMIMLYWTVRQTEIMSSIWNFSSSLAPSAAHNNNNNNNNNNNVSSPRPSSSSPRRRTTRGSRASLSQRTMETGLLYSGALILTYLPTGLSGFLPNSPRDTFKHVLSIAIVILLPLQGFFNLLIYTSDHWLPILENGNVTGWIIAQIKKICRCCFSSCQRRRRSGADDSKHGPEGGAATSRFGRRSPGSDDATDRQISQGRESTIASHVDRSSEREEEATSRDHDDNTATAQEQSNIVDSDNSSNNNNTSNSTRIRLQMLDPFTSSICRGVSAMTNIESQQPDEDEQPIFEEEGDKDYDGGYSSSSSSSSGDDDDDDAYDVETSTPSSVLHGWSRFSSTDDSQTVAA